jgi:hypothetical protein
MACSDTPAAGFGGGIGGEKFKHGNRVNHCAAALADVEQEFPGKKIKWLELLLLIFHNSLLAQRALVA